MPISLSPAAASKVGELLSVVEGGGDLALRVAVRPGGCSGLSYEMYFDDARSDDDGEILFGDVLVVVDAASAPFLEDAVVEYADGLSAGFQVVNPSADRTCGCGQSFS
jgi:iron-sulfur cluster assembly protein/iron-sulfur cluster insertion protein